MHVTDGCKVLIAEANKLKRQHAAGSDVSRNKTCLMHQNMLEKDLNALIDERILALKKNPKKEGKQVTFSSLKEARKYLAAKKDNKDESSSDEE